MSRINWKELKKLSVETNNYFKNYHCCYSCDSNIYRFEKKDETSYKIDIRGLKRLWGMEEFSIQKPVTRNYTYEYLFHN